MKRNTPRDAALIAALFVAGGVCGAGVYKGSGGLNEQHAHLEAEVPICMNGAGYEQALDSKSCGLKLWQGDVFCYAPKSFFGKLVYRIQIRKAESWPRDK